MTAQKFDISAGSDDQAFGARDFGAYVIGVAFVGEGAAFALGDGTVRFEGGDIVQAHDGAVLCAAPHPSGSGLVTGGDDGRLVWSRPSGAALIADAKGKWIDAVATSAASGLIAFAAGREVQVRDAADPGFARSFRHERSVADIAFDPKGRRLAAATYGGAMLWYARIAEQKPQALKWAGAHIAIVWSPDGRFLISSMQENALHGWRLSDGKDMRMGGYPSKVKSLAFLHDGLVLATSGAQGAVVWPFSGSAGPMGKSAAEVGFDAESLVTRVAAAPRSARLAAGLADGRVWTAELTGRGLTEIKDGDVGGGAPISALAVSPDEKKLAWGDEKGRAGLEFLANFPLK
jgi:WD40 repeat protein